MSKRGNWANIRHQEGEQTEDCYIIKSQPKRLLKETGVVDELTKF